MEVIKKAINDQITKVMVGVEVSQDGKDISGSVELDIENQSHFVDIINDIFEEAKVHVIVDMSHISYIDSSGLWALFEGHKKATQKNRKLVLLNPTKDVRRVLDITKMSSKLDIFDDLNAAVKSLE